MTWRTVHMLRITLPEPEQTIPSNFHAELMALGTLSIESDMRVLNLMVSRFERLDAVKALLHERGIGFVEWTQEM